MEPVLHGLSRVIGGPAARMAGVVTRAQGTAAKLDGETSSGQPPASDSAKTETVLSSLEQPKS